MQEWPHVVQAAIVSQTEKETTNVKELRSNVSGWANEVQASVVKLTEKETANFQQLRSNISKRADGMRPELIPGG